MPNIDLPLLHPPSRVLRDLLMQLGFTSVFFGNEPTAPDAAITVKDTTPRSDGRVLTTGEQLQHYGVTVRVRAADKQSAFLAATRVRTALDQSVNYTDVMVDTTPYIVYGVYGTAMLDVGKDAPSSKRSVYNVNCTTKIRRLA